MISLNTYSIEEIHKAEAELKEIITKGRLSAHEAITGDETYWEIYDFAKKISVTPEEFNLSMGRLRITYLDKRSHKKVNLKNLKIV